MPESELNAWMGSAGDHFWPRACRRLKTRAVTALCIVMTAASASCTPQDKTVELERAASQFHALYNAQNFAEIYSQSSRVYRKRTSLRQHEQLFADMYARDGKVVSTRLDETRQSGSFGATVYMSSYITRFERREAIEYLGFGEATTEPGLLLLGYDRESLASAPVPQR